MQGNEMLCSIVEYLKKRPGMTKRIAAGISTQDKKISAEDLINGLAELSLAAEEIPFGQSMF